MAEQLPHLHVIIGPTAAGKTAYGIELAQSLPKAAIVSADSRQIYSWMDIGTAKPEEAWNTAPHDILTPDSIEDVDHYLLNICTPEQHYTLPQWQSAAYTVIDSLLEQGITPILVGGTMLYVDGILKNYSIPEVAPDTELRSIIEQHDTQTLYAELLRQDPDAEKFVEPHHKQRIIRALEVIHTTGKPFSSVRTTQPPRYTFDIVGLFPGWDQLKVQVSDRAENMFKEGLIKETQHLQQKFGADLSLLKTMNYAQAAQTISGELSQPEALEATISVNMRYAHRQMSWWKKYPDIIWTQKIPSSNT